MRAIGIILIVLGILGFIVDNVSFTTDEQVADVGPVEIEQQEERSIPITPLAAGGAIVIGAGLVVVGSRK
jgi:uncharacterized membrane protein